MSLETKNHKLFKYEDNDIADLRFLHDSMDTIDKGLILDVGTSTGAGNDYVLNLGSITLSSANKGISFKFWADKDSNGAVTINGTYNLVKANGNPIKNIKANAPYTITYDGGTNFFLSSGGADESDSTTVGIDGSKVLAPETFIGSDGEIHTGTIPTRTAVNTTLKAGQSVTLDSGYYKDKSTIKAETLATAMTNAGVTLTNANQLVSGVKAVDKNGNLITGTATIESLGGLKLKTGTFKNDTIDKTGRYFYVGFRPKIVLIKDDSGGFKTTQIYDGGFTGLPSFFTNDRTSPQTIDTTPYGNGRITVGDDSFSFRTGDGGQGDFPINSTFTYTWYAIG